MSALLEVSRSGYYKWLKRNKNYKPIDPIEVEIVEIFNYSRKTYGIRRIKREFRRRGKKVNKKKIQKLMRKNGLYPKCRRKTRATTNSNHSYPVAPNILKQDFSCTRPNEIWASDITYIPTEEGWLYLAAIVDLYTRKVVGWALGSRMTKELTIKALEQAYNKEIPSKGLIHHSDRGSQYASYDYQEKLKEYNMTQSMSRKGNCYDNACAESFFSTLKIELVHSNKFKSRSIAKQEIIDYIETFYNSKRLHSSIDYVPPLEFELNYYNLQKAA